jgi:hypothetical protein
VRLLHTATINSKSAITNNTRQLSLCYHYKNTEPVTNTTAENHREHKSTVYRHCCQFYVGATSCSTTVNTAIFNSTAAILAVATNVRAASALLIPILSLLHTLLLAVTNTTIGTTTNNYSGQLLTANGGHLQLQKVKFAN